MEDSEIRISINKNTVAKPVILKGHLSETGLFEFDRLTADSKERWREGFLEFLEF